MRFTLLDRILELEPGKRIRGVKNLTMAEEYLAEHFPGFPVLPGVLMLEAATQTAAWLLRVTEGFKHSVILLQEAKAIRYGHFVSPGKQLFMECEMVGENGRLATFKVKGELEGNTSITGRIVLERFNLAERHPLEAEKDAELVAAHKRAFRTLAPPELREKLAAA
jgi:3-hydroxyacyl-[acyl-carrier-protein] dehydratase